MAVQFADKNLQLWGVQSTAQLKRQMKRKQAKARRSTDDGADGGEVGEAEGEAAGLLEANDAFQPLAHLRGTHKLHSFAFAGGRTSGGGEEGVRPKTARLLVADRANSIKVTAW